MRLPTRTRPRAVWCVAARGFLSNESRDWNPPGVTGIYHSDLDCPPLRLWLSSGPAIPDPSELSVLEQFLQPEHRVIIEADPRTGESTIWEEYSRGWEISSDAEWIALDGFRPCLRCGKAGATNESIAVCHRCHMTICDCD